MPSRRILAGLLGLTLILGACAQPTAVPTPLPEPTVAEATAVPATEAAAAPVDEPTVESEMVEPQPDDGAPDPGPAPAGGAEPAIQLIPMSDLNNLQVGREAQLAVLAGDSDGIDRVDLQVDGQTVSTLAANKATDFQGILAWTPDAAGEHSAVVIVFDALGLPAQAEQRTLNVAAAEPTAAPAQPNPTKAPAPTAVPPTAVPRDTTPPTVSITPLTPHVLPGEDIQIATNAVDESGIVKLELYMSNRLVDTWKHDPASGPPPRSAFQTLHFRRARAGQYDAWVRAYDAAGNVGESVRERVRAREKSE